MITIERGELIFGLFDPEEYAHHVTSLSAEDRKTDPTLQVLVNINHRAFTQASANNVFNIVRARCVANTWDPDMQSGSISLDYAMMAVRDVLNAINIGAVPKGMTSLVIRSVNFAPATLPDGVTFYRNKCLFRLM